MNISERRIAILGAGPSGLAQLRAFQSLKEQGEEIPEIVCYEKQEDWGGMWRYNWETGIDQNGEPVHGSMYRFLWCNGPKEGLEFGDYTFDEHFKRPMPSYLPREVLLQYILGRVEKCNVEAYIKFNHAVRWVDYDEQEEKFHVSVMDHTQDRLITERFDDVIVATGHFSTPNYPKVEGLSSFPGRVLHAHDFRDAREFKGQHLLIIGSSYSAEDIATQCYKYGASKVTFSYRSRPMRGEWPESFNQHPELDYVSDKRAHFIDGTTEEVDTILFCTGYKFNFPFLTDQLRLKSDPSLYPDDLYKGVVSMDHPNLYYLGMQNQYFTFNMFDAQAWYVRDIIQGKIALPSKEEQRADIDQWLERLAAAENDNQFIDFQADYIKDLLAVTDYPDFKVDEQGAIFKEWLKDKEKGILEFRDLSYRSTITGTLASRLPKPWMEMFEDRASEFLKYEFPPSE